MHARFTTRARYWRLAYRLLLSAGLLVLVWRELPSATLFSDVSLLTQNAWLFLALLLLPLNYLLEAIKWRQLLRPTIRPKLGAAVGHVLVGQASGFMTPNRLGDYAGRVLGFAPAHRLEAASATFSSRLGQLPATLLGGLFAALPLAFSLSVRWQIGLAMLALVLFSALLLLPQISRRSLRVFGQIVYRIRPSWAERLSQLRPYDRPTLTRLLALSLLRYVVFTLQYALLIKWLLPELAWLTALQLPALVFAAKTFIPSFAFAELGIRESLAIVVAGMLSINPQVAFEATLVLFVLNVLLPAAAGCLVVLFGRRNLRLASDTSPDAATAKA
ncbi:MAG: lysylphosphatidylglycerol synthase domain-containing protein [Bacteroidota bacterium]